MKNILTMALILIHFISFGQKNGMSEFTSNQSSVYGNAGSYLALDSIQLAQSSAITLQSTNPFWKISLKEINKITQVKITVPDTSIQPAPSEYYILFSLDPIDDTPLTFQDLNGDNINEVHCDNENIRLARLLSDSDIYSICVPRQKMNQTLYFDSLFVSHISIVSPEQTQLEIIEVDITGTEVPFYDVNNGVTGFQWKEKCDDNIDNNGDGLIDCEEYSCNVQYTNINYIKPSCPVCRDGKICITAMNVQQISFDGGNTWENFNDRTRQCFEQLPSGNYNIVFKSPGGCTKHANVDMSIPPGISNSICENGDFEKGDFTGYSFATGFNQMNPYGPFNLTPGFNSNLHNIINVENFSDPFVGNLINNPGFLGKYVFRLGDPAIIGSMNNEVSQMESLTFRFTVTSADFSFNYARVTTDPSSFHDDNELPFFYWEVTDLQGNIIYSETELSNSVLYQQLNPDIRFRGWDCAHADLSSYIGQDVIVRFINSDCGRWQHWAYTYIDNICAPSAANMPVINIEQSCGNIAQVCDDQTLEMSFLPGGYSSYQWVISKINSSGVEYNSWSSPIIYGVEAKNTDIVGYYETGSGFTTACGDRIKIVLRLMNGCSETATDPYFYVLSCNEYTVDYCKPMNFCRDGKDIQIKGTFDCPGCSIGWSPAMLLNNPNIPFPTVEQSQSNTPLTNKVYKYNVTTTEGCKFCGEVTFKKYGYEIVPHALDRGYCSYNYGIDIVLSTSLATIANIDIIIVRTNIVNGVSSTFTPSGSGNIRSISFNQLRDSETQYRFEVMILPESCSDGYTCKQSYTFPRISQTTYHAYWKAATPHIFSPNGDGVNDLWSLSFRSLNEDLPLNCSNISENNSSIYAYSVEIFDEWGNLIFSQSVSKSLTDTQGFTGGEITWDGTFNGQPVEQDIYVGIITTTSCYNAPFRCSNCNLQDPFDYCYGMETDCGIPYDDNNNNFVTECGIQVVR